MPNNLVPGALPNTGVDAGSLMQQGPQVDAAAMKTPPDTGPGAAGGGQAGSQPGAQPPGKFTIEDVKDTIHKQGEVDHELRALLDAGGPIPRRQVIDAAVRLVANRAMSAQMMAGFLADLPQDPQDVREWCERHAKDAESHMLQMMTLIHGAEAHLPFDFGAMLPDGHPLKQGATMPTQATAPTTATLQ